MVDILRIKIIIALLIYLPFFSLIVVNLLPPSATFEILSFWQQAIAGLIFLSLIYLLFLGALKRISEKFLSFYLAYFIFFYTFIMFVFVYIGLYQSPDLAGTLANLSVVPNSFLLSVLWGISVFTVFSLLAMKVDKKTLGTIFCVIIALSSGLVLAKDLYLRYKTKSFFGNYRKGELFFTSTFNIDRHQYVFRLADMKFKKVPKERYSQISDGLPNWPAETFSPDSRFKAYEYAYDRDDLSKIFIVNVKTGETLLLSQGESPMWVR